ncbi:MAG: acyltransferase [Thermodesulfobacteriota bacterium]
MPLRHDHRPYFLKKTYLRFQSFYVRRFIRPQLEYLGDGFTVLQPWNLILFGSPIRIGKFANIITTPEHKVRLSIWSETEDIPGIRIGDYCLICPGVRIGAARQITIGDNCMLAGNVYITDADWHGIYNRIEPGNNEPVTLEENVWVGDSAIVCKGVTIGRNSIIGAGAVVVGDIPPNTVAAGNPARVVKDLDTREKFVTREHFFSDPESLNRQIDELDRAMLTGNTLRGWMRALFFPRQGD